VFQINLAEDRFGYTLNTFGFVIYCLVKIFEIIQTKHGISCDNDLYLLCTQSVLSGGCVGGVMLSPVRNTNSSTITLILGKES
jgi:hypothetical protein